MRILYHHRVASRDGQYVHIVRLVAALRAAGAEVEVVGPPVERAPVGEAPPLFARARRWLPRPLFELGELAWGVGAALRLVRAARARPPDVIYERYGLHGIGGRLAARLLGVPLVLEVNSPLARERARFGGLALPRLARLSERWIWRGADRLVVVSRVLARMVAASGIPTSRIVVMPNGVDLERFVHLPPLEEAKRRIGLAGCTVLGFAGFVRPWHGLERVVELLARELPPEVVLLVVGDGPARAGLEAAAERLGVAARVRFAGTVAHEALPAWLAAFDVALQPAAVPWASPLKLVEYMAAGRCILAVDRPNIRELLRHGESGWLAPPDGFGPALRILLADPALRRRLGDGARAEVERRGLTWAANARRVLALVEELRARRAPPPPPHRER